MLRKYTIHTKLAKHLLLPVDAQLCPIAHVYSTKENSKGHHKLDEKPEAHPLYVDIHRKAEYFYAVSTHVRINLSKQTDCEIVTKRLSANRKTKVHDR